MCPWNVSFAEELKEPAFEAKEVVAGKDGRALSRDILQLTQEEFSAAFRHSPMKRAKLRGLKRNAAVVLGNVGTADDVDVLATALEDPEPLVREHAEWALGRIGWPGALEALRARSFVEPDPAVAEEVVVVLPDLEPCTGSESKQHDAFGIIRA